MSNLRLKAGVTNRILEQGRRKIDNWGGGAHSQTVKIVDFKI